ncbi:MAG TPA: hemerythrin domain-containing protein [Gammaproteobacteria bacterium]
MVSIITHFLNRWRHSDVEAPREEKHLFAPGTGIRYSSLLVEGLKADHQQFFELQRTMLIAKRNGHLEEIPALLQQFDELLTAHLLTEQVRLYAYMDAYFATDRRTREMLRDYRVEMDRIGDSVRRMIKKYRHLALDGQLQGEFEQDMEELRLVLDERMSREELTLYPLYMPVAG